MSFVLNVAVLYYFYIMTNELKLNRAIFIAKPEIAVLFSGCDVWLIPVEWNVDWDFEIDIPKNVVNFDKLKMLFENAYISNDWYVKNELIYGMNDEACIIAINIEQANFKFCEAEDWLSIQSQIEKRPSPSDPKEFFEFK